MLQGNTSTQVSKEPVTERMTINHTFVDNLGRLKLIQSHLSFINVCYCRDRFEPHHVQLPTRYSTREMINAI